MSKRPCVSKVSTAIGVVCTLILVNVLTSCGPKTLDRAEVIGLYGPEVINYFYETAFHTDRGGGIRDEALRWQEDIRVSLHGKMLENDSALVVETLSEINSLGLPISMNLVSDSLESNFRIFFGDAASVAEMLGLDSVITLGVAVAGDKLGAIQWAKIGILNNPKMYSQTNSAYAALLRKETISEEITQGLGIIGDSYTYRNSLFFEGAHKAEGLSDIDRKTVEFLYDNRVFSGRIMRKSFEQEYADVIYDRITHNKLYGLAREYGLDRHDLDSLGEMVFRSESGDRFVKFPRTAFLNLSGDSSTGDAAFCSAFVARFNTITPWFQLELAEEKRIWNAYPRLTIHYEEGEKYRGVTYTQVRVSTMEMMFTYHISADIWMKFHNPEKESILFDKTVSFHRDVLTRGLLKALGLSTRDKVLVNATTDSLEIDGRHEDYFRFLYDPRFPSGITRAEFAELLKGTNMHEDSAAHVRQ